MGHVLQAGQGQITARQAAIAAGIPIDVPAITINKVCLSGMAAIAMADQMIRAGEIEVAVAGGMESMTNAPFVLPKARDGAASRRHADAGLDDPRRPVVRVRRPAHGRRHRRDEPRVRRSPARTRTRGPPGRTARAAAAWDEGRFDAKRSSRSVPQRKGEPVVRRARRGHPGRHDAASAGGAPTGVHGRRARSRRATPRRSATEPARWSSPAKTPSVPRASTRSRGSRPTACRPTASPRCTPSRRSRWSGRSRRSGVGAADLGVLEVNEAFAGVAVHTARMLDVDEALVNPNGGAVALGHPIGASGARIVLTPRSRCGDAASSWAAPRSAAAAGRATRWSCARPGSGAWAGRSWRTPSRTTYGPRSV